MNRNVIRCKKCGSEIEVSEALTHQIEEQVLATLAAKHKEELEEAKEKALEEASRKAVELFSTQIKTLQKENESERKRNAKLGEQLEEMLDEMRELKQRDREREIEMKKKLMEEEEKVRQDAIKQTEEHHRLKDLEKDKKLQDVLKLNEELARKLEQGSQQTQGEALELEIEKILKREFPSDTIIEIKKGERGADIIQEIIDKRGRRCGTILWETKNAQWSNEWTAKLKSDQRAKKADLAALVTVNKPPWLNGFTYREGIWFSTWQNVTPLAFALRFNLISLYNVRSSTEGRNEKKDLLYEYVMSMEFIHRIEAIVEGFNNMQEELEREKRWFSVKWSRQEKEIRKVIDNMHGMFGDMKGIIGRSLPEIKSLGLPSGQDEEKD